VLPDHLVTDIFSKILCDFAKFDYINLGLRQFFMFQEFLFATNVSAKKIEITQSAGMHRAIKIKEEDTLGIKFVWDILMNCKNEIVLKELNGLIIIIYLHCETKCL
jgi:hypothetical protein